MASEQTVNCPKCGYEYESWVEVCPDCGTPLETRPGLEVIKGALDNKEDPRWTVVTNVPNSIMGNFIKGQLEDSGIPVLMFRSPSADIAEFSHNDFVPHDLLVPRAHWRDARRLIDSAPGNSYGPSLWPVEDEEQLDQEGVDVEASIASEEKGAEAESTLPEGWSMLPTEDDVRARQEVRRSHGEVLRGWYWSDGQNHAEGQNGHSPRGAGEYDAEDQWGEYDYDEHPDRYVRHAPNPYGSREYGDEWNGPNKWTRVVYGVLIAVLSLPFLIQVVQTLFSIWGGAP